MNRRTTTQLLLLILVLVPALLLAAGCGSEDDGGGSDETTSSDAPTESEDVSERADSYEEAPEFKLDPNGTYAVEMQTSKGTFNIDIDPKAAPIAAANFLALVEDGYYDGMTFHRVIEDFMVQAGDPLGDGTGGPGYELKDDPVKGSYDRGTVAMANAGPNTGGSQFFIVHGTEVDNTLPKDYIIFGSVDEDGMKVVDKIAAVEVEPGPSGEPSKPVDDVIIEKATIA